MEIKSTIRQQAGDLKALGIGGPGSITAALAAGILPGAVVGGGAMPGGGLIGGLNPLGLGSDPLGTLVQRARERYEAQPSAAADPLEERRRRSLDDIYRLLADIAGTVLDREARDHFTAVLCRQLLAVYDAETERQLDSVEAAARIVRTYVDQHRTELARRRRLGVLAVVFSAGIVVAIAAVIVAAGVFGWSAEGTVPLLGIPVTVLVWSVIGAFFSTLYRFTWLKDQENLDPTRWLVTRPLMGLFMGVVAYFAIKAGLILTSGDAAAAVDVSQKEVVWVVVFLAAFSDRFSDGLLRIFVSRFAGGAEDEALTRQLGGVAPGAVAVVPADLIEELRRRQTPDPSPAEAPPAEAPPAAGTPAAGTPAAGTPAGERAEGAVPLRPVKPERPGGEG